LGEHVGLIGIGRQQCIQVSDGRPEGKTPLWRPRRRAKDNIKMDLKQCVRITRSILPDRQYIQLLYLVFYFPSIGFEPVESSSGSTPLKVIRI
jgi:hypothetical protein